MPYGTETKHDDDSHREQIVFDTHIDWEDNRGGMERIGPLSDHMDSGIDADALAYLIEEGYVDPEGTQNRGPTMQTLLQFGDDAIDAFDFITVEYRGYMISPKRPDSRVTITSITIETNDAHNIPQEVQSSFIDEFRKADEFEVGDEICHAWWD
jgi:hypothetical protein